MVAAKMIVYGWIGDSLKACCIYDRFLAYLVDMSENENIISQRKTLVKELEKLKKEYNSIRDKSEKLLAVAKINEKKAALAQIRNEFIDFQTRRKK